MVAHQPRNCGSASYIVFCVPIFVCSQCLRRKSCYLPGSGHCLTETAACPETAARQAFTYYHKSRYVLQLQVVQLSATNRLQVEEVGEATAVTPSELPATFLVAANRLHAVTCKRKRFSYACLRFSYACLRSVECTQCLRNALARLTDRSCSNVATEVAGHQ
jgi:hypothetical protein